jgi:hypothetical protein
MWGQYDHYLHSAKRDGCHEGMPRQHEPVRRAAQIGRIYVAERASHKNTGGAGMSWNFPPSPLERALWLAFWYPLLLLVFAGITYLVLSLPVGAMTLEISGSSSGQGIQLLNFSGDQLNVSLFQNGTSWNMSLLGAA